MRIARSSRILVWLILLTFVLASVGCGANLGPKAKIGGVGGSAAGGLLAAAAGASPAGIVGGVLLGGLVGGAIGDRMDAADRREAAEAAQRAMETAPSGTSVAWKNPDSGNSGSVSPTRTYQSESGQYCREYHTTVTIDGEENKSYGTACRQPDGSWKIM